MKSILVLALLLLSFVNFSQTYSEAFKAIAFDRETEDRLGYSVDISGNFAIVGCYGDDFGPSNPNMGSAYIFEKTGIEDWTFVQKIYNSDQDDYDRFGWSVAIDGDMAVVGAYGEDEDASDANTRSKAGSAYIFKRGVDGVWTQMQKIVASDRAVNDEFGWSVDISDSTVIVGAHFEGHNVAGGAYEYHAGSAYIFDLGVGGVWTQTQKIVGSRRADDHYYPDGRPDPTEEDLSDLFGGSVGISGNYIVVGSHNHDYGPGGVGTGLAWNQGCAYIFERTGGVWAEVKQIHSSVRTAWDRFGYAVDIDTNVIIVGVWSEDENESEGSSLKNAGGAYIFERNLAGTWLQIQKLDASDRTTGDHFGIEVAIDGNFLVVGAEQEDIDGGGGFGDTLSNAGAAYIFSKDGAGVWTEIQKVTASDRHNLDLMGQSVGISGTNIIVGAWQQDYDQLGETFIEDAGAAYIYSFVRCETEFIEQDIAICAGESFTVGENTYTETGVYVDSLLNIDVCDSIVTTNLTVIEPVLHTQDIAICATESYEIGIHSYTVTGTYIDTLVAFTGCDSIVTTNLDVIIPVLHTQNIAICATESYEIGIHSYTVSGTYIDTLDAFTGCDSIVTTNLVVIEPVLYSQDVAICATESYEIGDHSYTVSGVYIDTLEAFTGCDSIVTTTLDVIEPIYNLQEITICSGITYDIGIHSYAETGTYIDTLVAFTGCDSIVTTELTVSPPLTYSQSIHLCYNESYTIGDSIYSVSGIYENLLSTDGGCDSIVTTDLFIEEENRFEQTITLCSYESYLIGESEYNESGEYIDTLVSATFCDSIVTTTINMLSPIDVSIDSEGITLHGGDPAVLSATYQWIKCSPYEVIPGANFPFFTADENGEYAVIITDGACTDTSDCISIDQVGLDDFIAKEMKLYPNPTTGQFIVAIPSYNGESFDFVILNSIGNIVYSGQISSDKTTIDLSQFAKGIYLIRLTDGENTRIERISLN